MSKHFHSWITTKKNSLSFWEQPIPSEKLDKKITDANVQKEIKNSNKNQRLYSYLEQVIVREYAQLIDYKLSEAFLRIGEEEFRDPGGFEGPAKSSVVQRNYFELRNQLEYFLKNDIQQHRADPDAELNAFRRWVDISDLLLKKHCYEGFLLVFVNLQLIARDDLIEGLPKYARTNYRHLTELSSPAGNHISLRSYMDSHKDRTDFSPLLFSYHAIAVLNETIEDLESQQLTLIENKKTLSSQIKMLKKMTPDENDIKHSEINRLRKLRRGVCRDLKNLATLVEGQVEQREKLIDNVKKEQKKPAIPSPKYANNTYEELKKRYDCHKNKQNKSQVNRTVRDDRVVPSTLYSQKLLPSMWKRTGYTASQHWEHALKPSI